MWRVGIEIRKILQKSNFAISVLTRLADHYNNDVERSEVARDLLPLPLPDISVEDEVDAIIMNFEDISFVQNANFIQDCWWYGSESWLYILTALLNFLHTGKDAKMTDLGVNTSQLNEEQKLAFAKLYHQIQLSIGYEPPVGQLEPDFSWNKVLKQVSLN